VQIRFHLDEHVAGLIAIGLRRRNIDVTTTVQAGLIGASDSEQLAFAYATARVMITQDVDYLRLDAQGASHAGIAYARQNYYSARRLLHRVVLLYNTVTAEDMSGKVEYL
jgi:predicted nuclease of predicted toxin-antitoxin system